MMSVAWAQQESQSSIDDLLKKAEAGDANAELQLAEAYEVGTGVTQDPAAAAQWCRKAADQGNAKAQNTLGVMYRQGIGVPRDKEQAFHWYKEAARKGQAEADYNVAISYFNGDGVGADLNRAYAWMWLAQRHGNSSAAPALKTIEEQINGHVAVAKTFVVGFLVKGDETPADVNEATAIIDGLAKDKEGMPYVGGLEYELCQDYATGKNVPRNDVEAKSWCKKAARDGQTFAFVVLGRMAEQGLGGARNTEEAETWYEDAAVLNTHEGILGLARLKSQGSHDDQKEAYFWLSVAQNRKMRQADALIQELAPRLSKKEIEKEQKRAAEWDKTLPAEKMKKIKYP
jgi:uncharacterized protein